MHDHLCGVSNCDHPTQDVLCEKHRDELVDALTEIAHADKPTIRSRNDPDGTLRTAEAFHPGLWEDLDTALAGQAKLTRVHLGRQPKGDHASPSFHEAAAAAKGNIQWAVWYWAYIFYDHNTHLDFISATVPEACLWLAGFPNLLASHADAAAMHADITNAVRQATRVTDLAPPKVYLGVCGAEREDGPCQHHLYALREHVVVFCTCGAEWLAKDRRDSLVRQVEDLVVNSVGVSRLLHQIGIEIASSTIRTYAQSKKRAGEVLPPKIVAAARDVRGRPLYRVGDVLDVFLGTQKHAA